MSCRGHLGSTRGQLPRNVVNVALAFKAEKINKLARKKCLFYYRVLIMTIGTLVGKMNPNFGLSIAVFGNLSNICQNATYIFVDYSTNQSFLNVKIQLLDYVRQRTRYTYGINLTLFKNAD